jgi:putative redox protein
MPMANNFRKALVRWSGGGLVFDGHAGADTAAPVRMDGDSAAGPSPMELLLLSLGGCMAIDVHSILEKSRVAVEELEVRIEGERAGDDPRRFTRIEMVFDLKGPTAQDDHRIARAIQLSEDKYCSVHHTLDPDLEVSASYRLI